MIEDDEELPPLSPLPAWQIRLIAEHKELCARIRRLKAYIDRINMGTLLVKPRSSLGDFERQLSAMIAYEQALRIRARKEGIILMETDRASDYE